MTHGSAPALPDRIDQVIERLDAIVERAVADASRLGYFAALYDRVTRAVRDAIRRGDFDDGPRMERLDVVFANRYLEAYARYQRGERPTSAWQVAFDATRDSRLSVLRHLILGMNAHINLDLGIACATVADGTDIESLHGDFNRINDILGSLLPVVEAQLGAISPRLGALSDVAHDLDRMDERVGTFSMEKARDGAWRFARRLSRLESDVARGFAIAARDAATALVATELTTHHVAGDVISGPDRAGIVEHIRILAD